MATGFGLPNLGHLNLDTQAGGTPVAAHMQLPLTPAELAPLIPSEEMQWLQDLNTRGSEVPCCPFVFDILVPCPCWEPTHILASSALSSGFK